jgi:cytochrome c-type biogenesis protein
VVLQSFLPDLSGNPLRAIPFVFAGGVLTSLTPCIYPMIPITAAIVGGTSVAAPSNATPSRSRPIALTLTYVLGLALVYSALGLFAGMTGTLFGSVSTNPWLYFAMANLLLIAALAMLDVFHVRLPTAIVERASNVGSAGRLSGAFGMGAMSGLVAAPCSAPVMAAVLTWVASTKSAVLGFVYLLVFSLVGDNRSSAARRGMDGLDQALFRRRHDRRGTVLLGEDGTAAVLIRPCRES